MADYEKEFPSAAIKLSEVRAEERASNNDVPDNKPRTKKAVSGPVKVRKNMARDIKDSLISEDAGSVKNYILTEHVIPGIKDLVTNMIISAVEMIFYGDSRPRGRTASSRGGLFNYNALSYDRRTSGVHNIYDRGSRDDRRAPSRSYNDIIFSSRRDADEVLASMDETLRMYGTCRVADLYDATGMDCNYTDYNFGWRDISSARVVPVRGGWRIDLPRPIAI